MSNVEYHLLNDTPKVGVSFHVKPKRMASFNQANGENVTQSGIVCVMKEEREYGKETEISTAKSVTEWCPHCEYENTIEWDVEKHGYKAFCPHCGNVMMLCDECQHGQDGAPQCDWDSKTGKCFRCGAKDGGGAE